MTERQRKAQIAKELYSQFRAQGMLAKEAYNKIAELMNASYSWARMLVREGRRANE